MAITNDSGNEGFVVVNDQIANKYVEEQESYLTYLVADYQGDKEECEEQFQDLLKSVKD